MKDDKLYIFVTLTLAVFIGLFGQSMSNVVHRIFTFIDPMYILIFHAMLSIIFFLITLIITYRFNKKKQLENNRYIPYLLLIIGLTVSVSFYSINHIWKIYL